MKAGIFYETGKVGVEELEKPMAGDDEAIIRVCRAGICGSDVYAYLDNDRLTCVTQKGDHGADGQFGHEVFGIVDSIGKNVKGINIGDPVFINPMTARRGGLTAGLSGGFSEYMRVEDPAYGYNMEKWDATVSIDQAALLEPMSVATHGKNIARITADDKVVILGGGAIGLCVLSAVLNAGCKNPVVVDRHENRLNIVKNMGGIPFDSSKDGNLTKFLMENVGRTKTFFGMPVPDVDAYIDCAGSTALLDQVLHAVKDKARISIVAGYSEPYPIDLSFLGTMQVEVYGSRAYDQADIEEAFKNIQGKKTDIDPIITHHFKLDDIKEAFETAKNRDSGAIKVMIDISEP